MPLAWNVTSKEFGVRLYLLRSEAGLSQKQLGARCGMSYQCISSVERGEYFPSLLTLRSICVGLGADINKLLDLPS